MLWLEFGQFTLFWLFTALLFPLEINLRNKKKILVIGFCKPPSLNDAYFMDQLPGALSFCTTIYDNFLLLGDFNISHDDERLKEFCNSFFFRSSYQKTKLLHGYYHPFSIDHIVTIMTSVLMRTCTVEMGISDYFKLIMSIWRTTFAKDKCKKLC